MSRLKRALRRDAEAFIPTRAKQPKPAGTPTSRRLVACLCSLVLFVSAAAVAVPLLTRPKAPSFANCYFSVDINPSVEFVTGEDGRVQSVTPRNKYASALLGTSQAGFYGADAEAVLLEVLELASEAGYLDRTQKDNAVLINILCESEEDRAAVTELLRSDAQKFFRDNCIFGVVLTSTNSQRQNSEAQLYQISPAKLELVNEIIRFEPLAYTKEQLAGLPVKELNRILTQVKDGSKFYFDDDELDELYDLCEDIAELEKDLGELSEEDEEDGEELEEFLEELTELTEEVNAGFGPYGLAFAAPDRDADLAAYLADMRVRTRVVLEQKMADYDAQLASASAALYQKYQENLKNASADPNDQNYRKQFEKDYEDWLEEQEELWEEEWDSLKASWEAARGLD